VGDRDFSKLMFAAHGLNPVFAKVAIKPGKQAGWRIRSRPHAPGRAPGELVSALAFAPEC
jgi:molybdopterin molybdotransferase